MSIKAKQKQNMVGDEYIYIHIRDAFFVYLMTVRLSIAKGK